RQLGPERTELATPTRTPSHRAPLRGPDPRAATHGRADAGHAGAGSTATARCSNPHLRGTPPVRRRLLSQRAPRHTYGRTPRRPAPALLVPPRQRHGDGTAGIFTRLVEPSPFPNHTSKP